MCPLYPSGNPILSKHIEQLHKSMERLFQAKNNHEIRLRITLRRLLVNDISLKMSKSELMALSAYLQEREVTNIDFGEGISSNELESFIKILSQNIKSLREEGGLETVFSENKFPHISINLTDYSNIRKIEDIPHQDDEVIASLKDAFLLETLIVKYLLGEIDELPDKDKPLLLELTEDPSRMAIFIIELTKYYKKLLPSIKDLTPGEIGCRSLVRAGNLLLFEYAEKSNGIWQNLIDIFMILDSNLQANILASLIPIDPINISFFTLLFDMISNSETIDIVISLYLSDKISSEDKIILLGQLIPSRRRWEKMKPLFEKRLTELGVSVDEFMVFLNEIIRITRDLKEEKTFPLGWIDGDIDKQETSEDLSLIQDMVSNDLNKAGASSENYDALLEAAEILLKRLEEEEETQKYANYLNDISGLSETLFYRKKYEKIIEILIRLTKQTTLEKNRPSEQVEQTKKTIREIASPIEIESLISSLQDQNRDERERTAYILSIIGEKAAIQLIHALADEKDMTIRRTLVKSLTQTGKETIPILLKWLSDKRWYLVRNITDILKEIGDENICHGLKKPLTHPDARVRREATRALGKIGGILGNDLLISVLNDRDRSVRLISIFYLGENKVIKAIPIFLKELRRKKIFETDIRFTMAIIKALGRIGSEKAIPLLEKLLIGSRWSKKPKNDEVKQHAARALASIGTEKAKNILTQGTESQKREIRQACQRAIRFSKL